ncbi:hypothetical protein Leryth_004042 [Lithospermum erythrorhizon]|nr:hypothetical protein Leryth_004042 [Lithospermum erythrorhizon]
MREGEQPSKETSNHEKSISANKNKKNKNKKRFTNEQIKSLESIFKLETRLDPRKKVQVANDLGLHPRQVAIWFQNRRARWKSKHLETEYTELKSKFDCLRLQFQSLKQEKEGLLKELELLRNLVRNHNGDETSSKYIGDDGNNNSPADAHATYSSDHLEITLASNIKAAEFNNNYEEKDEVESFKFGDYVDKSLDSSEEWGNMDLGGLFNHSNGTSKWWDF